MSGLICPNCGAELTENEQQYQCANGHCFDRAKQGYVNLLLSQTSAKKRHGDDATMVKSRTEFLQAGFYRPLLDAVAVAAEAAVQAGDAVLDVGCGEGYYTVGVRDALCAAGKKCAFVGLDISKAALKAAAHRAKEMDWAVASAAALPVKSGSVSVILNLFAPHCAAEFYRVLKKDGLLIRVIPLERHLFSLKAAVYDAPYENEPDLPQLFGFTLRKRQDVRYEFTVQGAQIGNLFQMTPYYYKTSVADFKKLQALDTLTTTAEFAILQYRKI